MDKTETSTTPARDVLTQTLDDTTFDTPAQRFDVLDKINAAIEEARLAGLTEYERDVLKNADENHIWVNAFTLIRPQPATYENIGRAVVHKLISREDTIVSSLHRPGAILAGIDGPSSRELVVRINQS